MSCWALQPGQHPGSVLGAGAGVLGALLCGAGGLQVGVGLVQDDAGLVGDALPAAGAGVGDALQFGGEGLGIGLVFGGGLLAQLRSLGQVLLAEAKSGVGAASVRALPPRRHLLAGAAGLGPAVGVVLSWDRVRGQRGGEGGGRQHPPAFLLGGVADGRSGRSGGHQAAGRQPHRPPVLRADRVPDPLLHLPHGFDLGLLHQLPVDALVLLAHLPGQHAVTLRQIQYQVPAEHPIIQPPVRVRTRGRQLGLAVHLLQPDAGGAGQLVQRPDQRSVRLPAAVHHLLQLRQLLLLLRLAVEQLLRRDAAGGRRHRDGLHQPGPGLRMRPGHDASGGVLAVLVQVLALDEPERVQPAADPHQMSVALPQPVFHLLDRHDPRRPRHWPRLLDSRAHRALVPRSPAPGPGVPRQGIPLVHPSCLIMSFKWAVRRAIDGSSHFAADLETDW